MTNGGTRSNQFKVRVFPPSAMNINVDDLEVMCSAASLPTVNVDQVTVTYRGRPVNFAGERTFEPWTITIINDMAPGGGDLRSAFEKWSGLTSAYDGSNGIINPAEYQASMVVHQLDRNERIIKSYDFFDAFPTTVGQIALSYDNPNIETFDVTFAYNYFIPTNVDHIESTSQLGT